MVIKMAGMGFKWYVRDRFNVFDAAIVFVNTVDIILSQLDIGSSGNSALSVFRGFRIL